VQSECQEHPLPIDSLGAYVDGDAIGAFIGIQATYIIFGYLHALVVEHHMLARRRRLATVAEASFQLIVLPTLGLAAFWPEEQMPMIERLTVQFSTRLLSL
jgi:hypothetical protein